MPAFDIVIQINLTIIDIPSLRYNLHITIELLLQILPTLDVPNMKRITCNSASLDQDSSI